MCPKQFVPECFWCIPFALPSSLDPAPLNCREMYTTHCLQVGFHPLWRQVHSRLMTMKERTAAVEKQKRGLHCFQRQDVWKEQGSKQTLLGHMPKARRR